MDCLLTTIVTAVIFGILSGLLCVCANRRSYWRGFSAAHKAIMLREQDSGEGVYVRKPVQ